MQKAEISKNQNTYSPPRNHNSSPAKEQNWIENEFDELTETGFRKWIINFSKLNEHVLTQCKEAKNLEERLDEMLTRSQHFGRPRRVDHLRLGDQPGQHSKTSASRKLFIKISQS